MRFSLMFQCVTSAVLACVICNFTPCNSVKLFQTSEQEDGELSEGEREDDVNKTAEELEEQNERDNELENKLEHARNIAEEAEIEEENAEDAIAKAAIDKEAKAKEQSPDAKLEALMQELINVAYRLRDVNQKLAILD